jgi:hypothetical protein
MASKAHTIELYAERFVELVKKAYSDEESDYEDIKNHQEQARAERAEKHKQMLERRKNMKFEDFGPDYVEENDQWRENLGEEYKAQLLPSVNYIKKHRNGQLILKIITELKNYINDGDLINAQEIYEFQLQNHIADTAILATAYGPFLVKHALLELGVNESNLKEFYDYLREHANRLAEIEFNYRDTGDL